MGTKNIFPQNSFFSKILTYVKFTQKDMIRDA